MAVTHIEYDHGTQDGSRLANYLRHLETALVGLNQELATLAHMVDGDGSAISHFDYVVERFKFGGYDPVQGAPTDPQRTLAKAAWDELNSLMFKLNTNGSVTDVNAALLQAFAKFR